ncbi:MAG: enoyl-CoA hydratase/isomerase family protein, partial [Rhodospirillaceae bacterium]|nr:enoyl-CoA hydratase/isomerase family protein [Rhodospirillaceae bacterium]
EADAQAEANASDYHRDAVKRFLAKEPALFDWKN